MNHTALRYLILLATAFILCGCPSPPPANPADLVLINGKIYTVDDAIGEAGALAVKDGRIMAVGTRADIEKLSGPNTQTIDLQGQFAMPGFIEGHGHLTGMGMSLLNLQLAGTRSWGEVVAKVAEAVKTAEPGTWIFGRGWHQEKWDQTPQPNVNGYPYHTELSAISPENPVILSHASGHAVFANAKAMNLAGISAETPDPDGGKILRAPDGNPIGAFSETAESLVRAAVTGDAATARAQTLKAIELAVAECHRKGITSFQDAGSSFETIDIFKDLAEKGELGLRLWVMIRASNERIETMAPQYKIKDFANHFLTVGGIKKYADGALGSRGAWLLEPYEDLPGNTGQNVEPLEDLEKTAQLAKTHQLQLCTHAIGDRANREVFNIYERVLAGEQRRWRIEHAQHLNPIDIPRFASLGVIASMQGIHCTSDAPFVVKRLGEKRAEEGAYVWHRLWESGAMIANGTDVPVEDANPLANLKATTTRITKSGEAFYPAQKLSLARAIRTYTLNNAYAAFEDDQKGSLSPGKLADIVVLSKDISTNPEALDDAVVRYTIIGGKIVYQSP